MPSTTSRTSEQRIVELEKRVRQLVRAVLALGLGGLLVLGVLAYILTSRDDARSYYNNQIRMLVCTFARPGEQSRDELRREFRCGRYVPPSASNPTSSGTPSTTRTVTGEARIAPSTPTSVPSSASTPSAVRQSARSGDTRSSMAPRPGPTRTVQAPRATRTVRATATATRTATTTPRGPVPSLLCTLLGCRTP